jgi:hypothetical protein
MSTHDDNRSQAGNETIVTQGSEVSEPAGLEFTPRGNTGCTFGKDTTPPSYVESITLQDYSFSFDYYQATIDRETEPFEVLRWASQFGESAMMRPKNGYAHAYDFGQVVVSFGGSTGEWGVNVLIQGGDVCDQVVSDFRSRFPVHRPSRLDVKIDFRASDAWDSLLAVVSAAASDFGCRTSLYGDWVNCMDGRTFYLNPKKKGVEAPVYSCRLYEKGHQLRSLKHVPDAPLDWVRLEFEIHPPKHSRSTVASLSAETLARSSRWMRQICDHLGVANVPAVRISTRRIKPQVVSVLENMCSQYQGRIVEAKRDSWMSRDEFISIMGDLWDNEEFRGFPHTVRQNWYF